MNEIRSTHQREPVAGSDLASADSAPYIVFAPGVRDEEQKVDREPGESDERYQARCDLLDAMLSFAKQGD